MSPRRDDALYRALQKSAPAFDAESGRTRFLDAFAGRSRKPARRPFALLAVAAAVAMAAGLLLWWRLPSALRFQTPEGEGQTGAWLATERGGELPLRFSEGSAVVLEGDSRGRVEELGRSGAVFLLERGTVRADVSHRESTDWRFRAGPFEVRVIGTRLAVEWDPHSERLAVRVDEGQVAVAGPTAGAVQMVRAGERCEVDLPTRTTRLSTIAELPVVPSGVPSSSMEPAIVPALPSTASPELPPAPPPRPAPPVPWTKLEERGDYGGAYAAATRAGWAQVISAASADELLRLAQVSRASGHPDGAAKALLACRSRFPGSDAAAVAAFELGRSRGGAEAARWLETYLRERPAGSLAREALGRLVEVLSAADDRARAKEAATRYLSQYPSGPHASLARQVSAAP